MIEFASSAGSVSKQRRLVPWPEAVARGLPQRLLERRVWIDRDWWYMQEEHRYDATGRMWRNWIDVRYWDPRTGEAMWRNVIITDPINRHGTIVRMNVDFTQAMTGTKQEYFDIEALRSYQ